MFLPEEAYFIILDPSQEQAGKIGQGDYNSGDADVIPSADPTVATEQQRLAKVQGLMELLQLGTVNPTEVTRRVLEAEEQPGIESLMQLPPPQPDPEMIKFQDESERAWAEIQLKAADIEAKGLTARANAILALAQAEAAEEGSQIEMYKMLQARQKESTTTS